MRTHRLIFGGTALCGVFLFGCNDQAARPKAASRTRSLEVAEVAKPDRPRLTLRRIYSPSHATGCEPVLAANVTPATASPIPVATATGKPATIPSSTLSNATSPEAIHERNLQELGVMPAPGAGPLSESAEAAIDETIRFTPTTRPTQPPAQRPPQATEENVDTNKPPREWQRATDDWFGLRPRLDDAGISFQGNLTLDYSRNFRGGVNTEHGATRNLLNLNVTFELERLAGWKGATVFANFQNQAGDNGSDLVGDIQAFDNVDADGRTQLSEVWFEQRLFDDRLRIKLGKIDGNSEFGTVPTAGEFINSSMGVSPTILAMPKYPDPAMSVNVFVHPTDWLYVGGGLYDGAGQEGIATGSRGPATAFGKPADLYMVGEVGVTWEAAGRLNGRFVAGLWHATGKLPKFDGGTSDGATGPYAIAEQSIWRENPADAEDEQGIAAFFQYGYADPSVSDFEHHIGGGLTWTGALPGRDDDVVGVGATWVQLGDIQPGNAGDEIAVELFYKVRVLKWLSLKPDLQYIHHPGGDRNAGDALVGTIRLMAEF